MYRPTGLLQGNRHSRSLDWLLHFRSPGVHGCRLTDAVAAEGRFGDCVHYWCSVSLINSIAYAPANLSYLSTILTSILCLIVQQSSNTDLSWGTGPVAFWLYVTFYIFQRFRVIANKYLG